MVLIFLRFCHYESESMKVISLNLLPNWCSQQSLVYHSKREAQVEHDYYHTGVYSTAPNNNTVTGYEKCTKQWSRL